MAEAVKVGLIRDRALFDWLVANTAALVRFDQEAVEQSIRRCAELHLAHIATGGDPFERGNARPLDYGHWAAHKLEMLTEHELRHGEAVSIGMALDAHYAVLVGMLRPDDYAAIVALLRALGLPTWHDALRDPRLLGGLDEFREHLGGELCITLLREIGRGVDVREIDRGLVTRSIQLLGEA
jgi:3-dehydroquinate synthase